MTQTGPSSEGTNLDPWYHNYADRTAGLSASAVRALFAVASRPEVVSLAGGMPFVSALPQDLVRSAIDRVLRDYGPAAMQYGSGQGTPELREHILQVMRTEGIRGSVDDVVVTTGSQHALDLISRIFLNPGDVVLAEAPSYVGAIGIFRSYQANIAHVPMDDEGMIPTALTETIGRLRTEGRPIKFLYLIPNFHNPAGVTLSWERRLQIIEIAKANDILIIEDNPYGLLWFDEPAPHAMRSVEEDGIVYLGSFSKTFAPGFRVGWALAPHGIREKLVLANESAVLSPSSFAQGLITEYLNEADWMAQIDRFRGIYRERRDAMLTALDDFLPDCTWTVPNGGFYVWMTMSDQLDSQAMLPRAVTELVAYTPGTAFYADGNGRQNIRLSFCYPDPEFIREGIRRLAVVINAEMQLVQTFIPRGSARRNTVERGVMNPPSNIG